jgi:predicted aldo/keto reductase-like oxidoreductase
VLPILTERGIACIGMKSMAGGHLQKSGAATPEEALRYAWSQPVAAVVSGKDSLDVLRANVRSARAFKPMSDEQQAALLERTREAGRLGRFEWFKVSRAHDGREGRLMHGIPA